MCVWCPLWPVQRLLSTQPEPESPCAIVLGPKDGGGAPRFEEAPGESRARHTGASAAGAPPPPCFEHTRAQSFRDRPLILFAEVRRNLHVTACSREAVQLGVRPGMPLGEARSLLPTTSSRRPRRPVGKPVFQRADPAADRTRLQALALHCQRYSPLAGAEDGLAPESLWLDISGSEALFGGERGLVEAVRTDLAQQGIQVRIAIADSWGTAWAVSHFGESVVSLVAADEQATALEPLPVAALRVSDTVIDSLQSLDVTTVGRLMKLPRASLPSRFGKELVRRLDQALGLVPELLTAERSIEPVRAEWLFDEPVLDRQALDHVCELLLDRILAAISVQRAALRELTCHWLGTTIEPVSLRLLRPTTDRRHLLELLRLQCERCVFTSGVTGVRMEVVEMGLPCIRQGLLFDDDVEEEYTRSLAELVDRLSSRIGRQSVLRSNLQSDPLPERSCHCVPWLNAHAVTEGTHVIPSRLRCRPLRLLRVPQSLPVEHYSRDGFPCWVEKSSVVCVSGPERIETGWWRDLDVKRDYYRLDLANGARLWAFCDLSSGRWFLHGLF